MPRFRSLVLAGTCAIPACSLFAPTDSELSADYGKTSDASDSGFDSSTLDAGDTDSCAGSKSCDGQCVALTDPAFGCTPSGCDPCNLDRAIATCEGAECRIASCESGYLDVNRSHADGCELTAPIPTDGLVLWLAADDGIEESGGRVVAWHDRSARRYDHSQPNFSIRPTLVPDTLNGKPVVAFQSQRLESASFAATFADGFSLFAIVQRNTSSNSQHVWGGILDLFDNDSTNGLFFARHDSSDDFIASYKDTPSKIFTQDGSFAPDVPHLVALTVGPTGFSFRWDGQVPSYEAPAFEPVTLKIERSYLGGTSTTMNFHSGWLAEIIMYERALPQPASVEQYLKSKWACCP